MISSAARDLPEHRKEVLDACARQGVFPLMMEHLPALDADASAASLQLVEDAESYPGGLKLDRVQAGGTAEPISNLQI